MRNVGASLRIWPCVVCHRRAYDVVRVALGLLLLVAATLKGHQLATEPTLQADLFSSRWHGVVPCCVPRLGDATMIDKLIVILLISTLGWPESLHDGSL
jgi:hypothetical protein